MQFRLLRSSRGGPTSYPSALLLADAGLYTMLAPELLSFVDLFHHQHELGEDSAQIDGAKLTASDSLATLVDYLPNAIVYLLAHTICRRPAFTRGRSTTDKARPASGRA
jgi:hypothetical protein